MSDHPDPRYTELHRIKGRLQGYVDVLDLARPISFTDLANALREDIAALDHFTQHPGSTCMHLKDLQVEEQLRSHALDRKQNGEGTLNADHVLEILESGGQEGGVEERLNGLERFDPEFADDNRTGVTMEAWHEGGWWWREDVLAAISPQPEKPPCERCGGLGKVDGDRIVSWLICPVCDGSGLSPASTQQQSSDQKADRG